MPLAASSPAIADEDGTIDIHNNGWGMAYFVRYGDKLKVCDENADGLQVRATVEKWYESMETWQAVGKVIAPGGECNSKTINVEPDRSLIRIHMWAVDSDGAARKVEYSDTGHA